MPNRDLALEAYPSHYMTFLRSAALQRVVVPMPYKRAIKTRAAIYKMRKKMELTKHPSWNSLAKVILQVEPISRGTNPLDRDGHSWALIGSPNSEVIADFEAAGIMPDTEIGDDMLGDLESSLGLYFGENK